MSKIQEIIHDDKSILVFDVDGVLAKIEYGDYNHYDVNDEEWIKKIENGARFYSDDDIIQTMVDFIKTRNIDNIYVCSKTYIDLENQMKVKFLTKNYGIKEDHIYFVNKKEDKVETLRVIKEKYPELEDKYIVLVDDSVEVLDHVMYHSGFSTVHISSFM